MNATRRLEKLRGHMEERGISAALITQPDNQFTLQGPRP